MRPPQNAGDSVQSARFRPSVVVTSMRPPQNAGDSVATWDHSVAISSYFNEAPRKTRGFRDVEGAVADGDELLQ